LEDLVTSLHGDGFQIALCPTGKLALRNGIGCFHVNDAATNEDVFFGFANVLDLCLPILAFWHF